MIMAYGLVRDGLPSGLQFSIGYLKWFEYNPSTTLYKLIEFWMVPPKTLSWVDIALFCNIFQQLCSSVTKYLKPYCLARLAVVSLLTMISSHSHSSHTIYLLYFIYKETQTEIFTFCPGRLTKFRQKETACEVHHNPTSLLQNLVSSKIRGWKATKTFITLKYLPLVRWIQPKKG